MRIPKRYGHTTLAKCPFCDRPSTAKNKQDVPVCRHHKTAILGEMKCVCGEYLMMQHGKRGMFFICMKCGNMNARRVFEINEVKDMSEQNKQDVEDSPVEFSKKKIKVEREEINITSDDPNYF